MARRKKRCSNQPYVPTFKLSLSAPHFRTFTSKLSLSNYHYLDPIFTPLSNRSMLRSRSRQEAFKRYNIHDQSLRYNILRQGDRELISAFKTRFDNQVKSNQGVGIPEISDALRAMDFIGKLDPKKYKSMLTCMRNSTAQNLPGSYPKTLAGAYRTVST